METKLVFTGGGTAGHVFPGLAVIEKIRKTFAGPIIWIGSRNGIERRIVQEAGIQYVAIPSGKLRRYFDLRNVLDVFRVLAGVAASIFVLARLRPSVVFSKGGYVSVPPTIAARLLGIRSITHESDLDPGLATRINARFADEVLFAYPEAASGFATTAEVHVTGNPVREAVYRGDPDRGRSLLGVEPALPVVFFVGGSLGAWQINSMVEALRPRMTPRFFVVHQCGNDGSDFGTDRYLRRRFIYDEYPHYLAAASLVVSRAGANTLWELAATGTPAVLVPLSTGASRGDQVRNAAAYARTGGAVVLDSERLDADILYHTIVDLLDDPNRLRSMADGARRLGARDAAEKIAARVLGEG